MRLTVDIQSRFVRCLYLESLCLGKELTGTVKFLNHFNWKDFAKGLLSWKTASMLVFLALIISIVYICYGHNGITAAIQGWGLFGVIAAVVLMAAFHMTPIPSDGLLIMYFKVFGVSWGLVYGWVGSLISALAVYFLARSLGQGLLRATISQKHFDQVDNWVQKRGQRGLFMARLLPIPAFAINCVAGLLPSVRLWAFLWTAALSIVPYFLAMALVYVGMSTTLRIWAIVGAAALILMWIGSCTMTGQKLPNPVKWMRSRLGKGRSRAY
jgi:uncharacterized membrane protein YdjX (TVP38/TMEM64 family)